MAGFDVNINLRALRKKLPNILFQMLGHRMSL